MRRTTLLLACTALAVILAGGGALLAGVEEAEAAFPGNNGQIGGEGEWSPDGTKVVFSRGDGSAFYYGNDSEIFVKDAASGTTTQLTDNSPSDPDNPEDLTTDDRYPAWSPDGTKIVFVRDEVRGDLCSFLYVMNSDGSDQRRLGSCNNPLSSPAWSPDGSKIAYVRYNGDWYDIEVMDADGTNAHTLYDKSCCTDLALWDGPPEWSPNGKKLVFVMGQYDDVGTLLSKDVWKANADGSERTRLAHLSEADPTGVAWSPDGTKIAFVRDGEVWTMRPDGSNQTDTNALAPAGAFDWHGEFDWQPVCPCPEPPSTDATDPTVTRLRPAPGAEIRDRTPTIKATVRDETTELSRPDVKLYIDGAKKAFSYDEATDRLTRTTGRLSYGGHRVRIVATDAAGNAAEGTWTFRVIRGR